MRVPSLVRFAVPALLVGAGFCVLAVSARAGDAPAAPRKVESAFLRGFAGDWDTEMTEGKLGKNRGNAKWQLTLGETALEEDYSSSITGADGKATPWRVRVVAREVGGGKVEAWLFDTRRVAPIHFAGTLTDTGFDVAGETSEAKFRVACEKKGENREFRMWRDDAVVLVETHRPAAR